MIFLFPYQAMEYIFLLKFGMPHGAFFIAQSEKNLHAVQETQVWFLGLEDPLEKEMATHSSILAWRIPWTEEPRGLRFHGVAKVGCDLATKSSAAASSMIFFEQKIEADIMLCKFWGWSFKDLSLLLLRLGTHIRISLPCWEEAQGVPGEAQVDENWGSWLITPAEFSVRTNYNNINKTILDFLVFLSPQFSSVQSLSRVQLFVTPWIAAHQASLSITNSQSSLRLTSIESVMPSSHLVLCRPLLLLPPIPPSIRVFSNESTLRMRWPKYWSSSFSIILPKKSQGWSPSEWTSWISLQSKGLSRVFFNTTVHRAEQVRGQKTEHILYGQ